MEGERAKELGGGGFEDGLRDGGGDIGKTLSCVRPNAQGPVYPRVW